VDEEKVNFGVTNLQITVTKDTYYSQVNDDDDDDDEGRKGK
jgi:hypothetical protein